MLQPLEANEQVFEYESPGLQDTARKSLPDALGGNIFMPPARFKETRG